MKQMENKDSKATKSKFAWAGMPSSVMMKNLTFVFFLAFLGVVYIFNSHYAENNLRKTKQMERKIREAKWEYMSLKSDIMQKSTRSEIGKKLNGFEDLDDQKLPKKIEASKS